jgi:hypothetical protein
MVYQCKIDNFAERAKELEIINIILKNCREILPILAPVWCDRKSADKHKFALRHGSSCNSMVVPLVA